MAKTKQSLLKNKPLHALKWTIQWIKMFLETIKMSLKKGVRHQHVSVFIETYSPKPSIFINLQLYQTKDRKKGNLIKRWSRGREWSSKEPKILGDEVKIKDIRYCIFIEDISKSNFILKFCKISNLSYSVSFQKQNIILNFRTFIFCTLVLQQLISMKFVRYNALQIRFHLTYQFHFIFVVKEL